MTDQPKAPEKGKGRRIDFETSEVCKRDEHRRCEAAAGGIAMNGRFLSDAWVCACDCHERIER